MEVPVGVGHRVAVLQQPRRQVFGGVGVAPMHESLIDILAPNVEGLGSIGLEPLAVEGLGLELVADVDRERRHEVLAEVFVLVVAPDKYEVRVELVDLLA